MKLRGSTFVGYCLPTTAAVWICCEHFLFKWQVRNPRTYYRLLTILKIVWWNVLVTKWWKRIGLERNSQKAGNERTTEGRHAQWVAPMGDRKLCVPRKLAGWQSGDVCFVLFKSWIPCLTCLWSEYDAWLRWWFNLTRLRKEKKIKTTQAAKHSLHQLKKRRHIGPKCPEPHRIAYER